MTTGLAIGLVAAVLTAVCLLGLLIMLTRSKGAVQRQALARERELRRACAELLSATDVDAVTAVVRDAVARLLPGGTAHGVTLVLGDGAPPASDPGSTMTVEETRNLPADVAARLPGHDLVLNCPLSVGGRHAGRLYVAAGQKALVDLQQAVPVLAGQAACMIDRVRLHGELDRRDREAYFRTLVLNAPDPVLIVDDDGRVRYGNPSAADLLGPADLTGRPLPDLFAPDQRTVVLGTVEAVRSGARVGTAEGWTLVRPTGERVETEVSIRDLRHEPSVDGIVLTLRDVTEQRRLLRDLGERAYVDPLTGLGTRLLFQDELERAVAAPTVTGVLLIELDLRAGGGALGHEAADELLRAAGERLRTCLDGGRTVARLGADEFGVLVEGAGDALEIDALADHVMDRFAAPFVILDSTVTVRLNIGAATTADTADTADTAGTLLARAGVALRAAGSPGQGRWRRYEAALDREIAEQTRLRAELAHAIADDQLVLHFQPIIELGSGRVDGFESLVRWRHPERGLVPPGEFIGFAEESGLIVPLGSWVLERSIREAVGWHDLVAYDPPHVSVNVSARQFRAPGFVEHVLTLINRYGLAPDRLALEITEDLTLAEPEEIWEDLWILRNAGVRVSIDDFGTGYSSLSHLHRVPADVLKLDRSLIETMSASGRQYELVAGIVRLARTLRLDVVAEGVETPTERTLLHGIGCRYGQGYLIAHPLPADEVAPWLTANAATSGLSAVGA